MNYYSKEASEVSIVEIKKQQYISEILLEIYSSGSRTIAQLAKSLHTSVPSITVYINELIQRNWIEDTGASITKSGRRPSLFNFKNNHHNILVIDINIDQTMFYIIDMKNNILESTPLTIEIQDAGIIESILKKAEQFIVNKDIWAVGISAPGLLNIENGINYSHPNLNKNESSLAIILGNHLGLSTFMCHDSQASMIGEHHFGLAKGLNNVLLINLDWGIGLGILSNGHLINGANGFAGELGHIQVKPDGVLCHCGKKGCLETVASALALVNKAKEGLRQGKTSTLALKGSEITLEDLIEAALKGDEYSIDLIFEIGKELGKGLSIAIHMFNPELIIIDGKLTDAGELIVSTLNQSINKYCLFDFKKNLNILISPMGEKAKLYGTKSHVFYKMMALGYF